MAQRHLQREVREGEQPRRAVAEVPPHQRLVTVQANCVLNFASCF